MSSEDSDSDSSQSNTGTGVKSGHSIRKKYSKIIESCQELGEKDGFDGNVPGVIENNILKAQYLFGELSKVATAPPPTPGTSSRALASTSTNQTRSFVNTGGPQDWNLSFLCTKSLSALIRYKTDAIGTSSSGFKVEEFLDALASQHDSADKDRVNRRIVEDIVEKMNPYWKVHPTLIAVVGTLDKSEITTPKEKEKTKRAPILRKQFNENEALQHEEVSAGDKKRKNTAEMIAKKLDKILRHHTKKTKAEATNLFEFVLDPASLHKSVEYMFYVAFLVQDGWAALQKEGDGSMKELGLQIKPEEPEARESVEQEQPSSSRKSNRNQFILSFTPKTFKKLCEASAGPPTVSLYSEFQDLVEAQEEQQQEEEQEEMQEEESED